MSENLLNIMDKQYAERSTEDPLSDWNKARLTLISFQESMTSSLNRLSYRLEVLEREVRLLRQGKKLKRAKR